MIQLIYTSAALRAYTGEDLRPLVVAARAANGSRGVSGMLLYHARCFVQVLEGSDEAVDELYGKVRLDPRHTAARIIYRGSIDRREFEPWPLGFVYSAKNDAELIKILDFSAIELLTLDRAKAVKLLRVFQEGHGRRHADRGRVAPAFAYSANSIMS